MYSLCVSAMQVKTVKDNEVVHATISIHDMTRIFIDNDRIKEVKGLKGQYILSNDDQKGDVYIRPTNKNIPINLYVLTEKNKTYQLKLRPQEQQSESIMLMTSFAKHTQLAKKNIPFEHQLIHVIKNMDSGNSSLVERINTAAEYYKLDSANVLLKEVHLEEYLRGEVYHVFNKNKYPLAI